MRSFLVIFSVLFGATLALDCTQIQDDQIKARHFVTIPNNVTEPVAIPPNFSCVYKIKVPSMMYAHIRLESYLKGGNDLITVIDGQFKKTLVSSRNQGPSNFYVFPNTTMTIQVTTKSVDNGSKFRITVFYQEVPTPLINNLKTGDPDIKYFFLNDLQLNSYKQPITMVGDQPLVLTIASSHWDADLFFNYFIVDGDLNQNKGVYHFSDYVSSNFVSSGNKITVMGLDNRVSESSVIFTPFSEIKNYNEFTGVTTYYEGQSTTVNANGGHQNALTVISHLGNQTTLMGMTSDAATPTCSILAVSTPNSPNAAVYQDLRRIDSFPHIIPYKKFAIIVENCSATFTMVSPRV